MTDQKRITKRIDYRERGLGDEDYIFLDYDPKTGEYTVRTGYSYKKSGKLEWEGKEDTYSLAEFQRENPKWNDKIAELIEEIEAE